MPKFMKSIQIPMVLNAPAPIDNNVIIYGNESGINQASVGGNKNLDLAGDIVNFSFSDISPIFIGKSQPNLSIGEINIEILTPFNNLLTTISIGDSLNNSRLFDIGSNDPNSVGKYSCNSDYRYTVETDIYLYINGVNTSGNGTVEIYFE